MSEQEQLSTVALFKMNIQTDNQMEVEQQLQEKYIQVLRVFQERGFQTQLEQAVFTIDRWTTIGQAQGEGGISAWRSSAQVLTNMGLDKAFTPLMNWILIKYENQWHVLTISDRTDIANMMSSFYEFVDLKTLVRYENEIIDAEDLTRWIDEHRVEIESTLTLPDLTEFIENIEFYMPNYNLRVERASVLVFLAKNYPYQEWQKIQEEININPEKFKPQIEKYFNVVKKKLHVNISPEMLDFIPS